MRGEQLAVPPAAAPAVGAGPGRGRCRRRPPRREAVGDRGVSAAGVLRRRSTPPSARTCSACSTGSGRTGGRPAVPATPPWRCATSSRTSPASRRRAGRPGRGCARGGWTAAQVTARADATPAEILAEWQQALPAFVALLDGAGAGGEHLHLRHRHAPRRRPGGARARPRAPTPRPTASCATGCWWPAPRRCTSAGLPTLRVVAGDQRGPVRPGRARRQPHRRPCTSSSGASPGGAAWPPMRGWGWDGRRPGALRRVLPGLPAAAG